MIQIASPEITNEDIVAVVETLKNGYLSGRTPICTQFEQAFAAKMDVQHAIAVNSGTSALFLALKALGIGPGDEVIVPDYCFIAVANAVVHVGATPVLCDVERTTYNLDIIEAKKKISGKTRAIIAVHTYGLPCDMDALMALGLPVIEDAAEAHGATYKGRQAGSIGTIGCFSFFANKTITTGEGGMVVTNIQALADEIRLLKDQYRTGQYQHAKVGYGMSLGAMQCALGLSQLKRLDQLVARKREIAQRYHDAFGLGRIKDGHSYWMYAFEGTPRPSNTVETRPAFVPLHHQPPYKSMFLENSTKIYNKITCLPCGVTLTNEEQDLVIRLCSK